MNTATNVGLLTVATGAIAKGVEVVTTNLWAGIAILVVGIVVLAIYEHFPSTPPAA